MTSSVPPNEWPCSWQRCHVWCAEAAETSVRSSSAPRTSRRPLMKSRGWLRKWPSSALTSVSGLTSSRSVQSSSSAKTKLASASNFWSHLTFLPCSRCASAFPPSALSSKSCPQSRPPCWVVPTSAKRSQSRWAASLLWVCPIVFSQNSLPHHCVSSPTGYWDVGAQCSEPDAVCEGDGQGGRGSFH